MTNRENIEVPAKGLHESVTGEEPGKSSDSWIKNAALFFASPFIAIAYAMALPFVGFYQFTKLSHEARVKKQKRLAKRLKKSQQAKKSKRAS